MGLFLMMISLYANISRMTSVICLSCAAVNICKVTVKVSIGKYVNILKSGDKVLVCGCPCQMAAMRAFLRKDYDNLIIVDFICRAIDSPKAWRKYLDTFDERYESKVIYCNGRNQKNTVGVILLKRSFWRTGSIFMKQKISNLLKLEVLLLVL